MSGLDLLGIVVPPTILWRSHRIIGGLLGLLVIGPAAGTGKKSKQLPASKSEE